MFVDKFSHTRFEPCGWTKNPDIPHAKSVVDYIFRWLGIQFIPGYREANTPKREPEAGAEPKSDPKNGPVAGAAGPQPRTGPTKPKPRRPPSRAIKSLVAPHPTATAQTATLRTVMGMGTATGNITSSRRVSMNPCWTARPSAASSSPRSRPMPLPATTAAQSRSATATATSVTIVGTAWDVADGSAASPAGWHPGLRRDQGAFYCARAGRWIHCRRPRDASMRRHCMLRT